jgi:hypothetical protein
MFYLYAIQKHSDHSEEIPEDQREWWWLVLSSEDKQALLDWYNKYRYTSYHSFKIVNAQGSLPDFFYPRREINRRTNAGKLLKAINWKKELWYENAKNSEAA